MLASVHCEPIALYNGAGIAAAASWVTSDTRKHHSADESLVFWRIRRIRMAIPAKLDRLPGASV
jgi:hypothetical protein